MKSTPHRIALALSTALLVTTATLAGIAVRRTVLNAQRVLAPKNTPLPFVLESALAFRRIQTVYRDGALPIHDRAIEWPTGITPRQYDTLGSEYLYAAAARAWPGTRPLMEKLRWIALLWFVTAIPGLFCWVRWMGAGNVGAFIAASLYAVCISAVARSTGQDFLHEADALPLVAWHLACWAWADSPHHKPWARRTLSLLSAALLALALCAWDGVQLYLLFLSITAAASLLQTARQKNWTPWLERYLPLLATLTAAVCFNPYLHAHFFTHAQAYSHFASLLYAKLAFLNQRPADPSLLTFDQRILWTPALHSTHWPLLKEWVPCLLPATILATLSLLPTIFRRYATPQPAPGKIAARHPHALTNSPALTHNARTLSFATLFFFLAFLLFFRLHVWFALFSSALCGLAAGRCFLLGGWKRIASLTLAAALIPLAACHTLAQPLRWASTVGYLPELRDLTSYLREHLAPEPVVANFGVSAAIAAYGGCPIVLHPKFESPTIRQQVQTYGKTLFTDTETNFRDWMAKNDAVIYVYSMGEFSTLAPGYQMRYMVNALSPPENAAARQFEFDPNNMTCFVPIYKNRKYRVFRMKNGPTVARHANAAAARAQSAFQEGRFYAAEAAANRALLLQPNHPEASRILSHIDALARNGMPSADFPEDASPPPFAPANPPLPLPPTPAPAPTKNGVPGGGRTHNL